MRVSIAMATYNGQRFLAEQLASLARQTRQPYELIVTDDNSTDATADIVARFATTAPFPVKFHRNSTQLGFAENFMLAMRGCSGDAIAFCDQDDVWHKEKLARCVAELKATNIGLVFHQYQDTDAVLRPIGRLSPRSSTSIVFERLRADKNLVWVAGCTMVVRHRVVEEVFRCWPKEHAEMAQGGGCNILAHDCATFYVANGMGEISYVAEPLVWHRIHENNTCTVNPSFRHSVIRALKMSGVEYRRRSYLLHAQGEMYERMAESAKDEIAKSLLELARKLHNLANINRSRSRLYGLPSVTQRIDAYVELVRTGAYSNLDGRPGNKALLIDLAFSALPLKRQCRSRTGFNCRSQEAESFPEE